MDISEGYNIVTTMDGIQYHVPKHLTQEQAFRAVASIDPVAGATSGIFENMDDTLDYNTGVLDSALRGR